MSNPLAKRSIPKRLEEDLSNIPKFKPTMRDVPRKSVSDIMSQNVEAAMYDEILGPLINRKTEMPPRIAAALANSSNSTRSSPSPSSGDLTVSLLSRLTDCESELKTYRRQLAEKLQRITELEDENKELKLRLQEPDEVYNELDFVKGQNEDLMLKLKEMEQFLDDYGLVWVGKTALEGPKTGSAVPGIAFSDFAKKVQELNDLIHSEPAQVQTEEGGKRAKFVRPSEILENIKIVFYKNGLMVRRGPFRAVGSDLYQAFTRDIIDGYFPSEFRQEYPDGVVFVLVDKHDSLYDPDTADDAAPKLSAAQLLQRLPKTMIRNGEVVDIRGDLETRLSAKDSSDSKSGSNSTPADSKYDSSASSGKKRVQVSLSSEAWRQQEQVQGSAATTTVQIRWLDGSVVVVKLMQQENVGIIRELLLNSFGAEAILPKFELRTVWPARAVEDTCCLLDANLVPNGTLHAWKI